MYNDINFAEFDIAAHRMADFFAGKRMKIKKAVLQ